MSLKKDKLYILMLEDVVEDAELTLYEIKRAGYEYDVLRVDNISNFKKGLKSLLPNVILSDYNLPTCNALDAYKSIPQTDIPFIIVSGIVGEEKAVEALKLGVTDLVSKNSLSRLPLAIERALKEQKVNRDRIVAEHEHFKSKERLELAFEGADLGTFDLDLQTNKIVFNERSLRLMNELKGDFVHDFDNFKKYSAENINKVKTALEMHLNGDAPMFESEFVITKRNKEPIWMLIRGKVTRQSEIGEVVRVSGTLLDISQRKRNEQEILKTASILEQAESVAQIGSFEWDYKEDTYIASDEYCKIFEIEKDGKVPVSDLFQSRIHPEDKSFINEIYKNKLATYDIEHRVVFPDSDNIKVVKSIGNVERNKDGHVTKVLGIVQDITNQREVKKSIFNAQAKERRRIARDIHDGIGQMLVATKYKLAAINEAGDEEIEEVEDLMGTVIEEVRRVSRNLSNRYVEEFGINTALDYLINDLSNYDVTHTIDVPKDYDIELCNTIYRITQEAINNIIKYSKAKNVDISILIENQNLIMEIIDDGIGFDDNKTSNGIKNMQERASLFNGHFEINSEINRGTKIKAWFPLTL